MRTRNLWLAGAMAIALLALVLTGCGSSSEPRSEEGSTSAPPVTVVAPADFNLADYAGKPVVMNFFGSWCAPCESEAPELSEFVAAHPEAQFVAVAFNDEEQSALGFLAHFGLGGVAVIDDYTLSSQWAVNAVPTTVFFTTDGREATRIVGAATRDRLEDALALAQ